MLFKGINYKNKKILDYGCGIGRLYEALDKPKDYTGIDISQELINDFKKRYSDVNCYTVDGFNIPSNDKSYDIIICYSVLTHIPEKHMDFLMKEFSRVIKNNGYIAVSIFDSNHVVEFFNWKTIDIKKFESMVKSYNFEIINRIEVPDYNTHQELYLLKKRILSNENIDSTS